MMISLAKEPPGRSIIVCVAPDHYSVFDFFMLPARVIMTGYIPAQPNAAKVPARATYCCSAWIAFTSLEKSMIAIFTAAALSHTWLICNGDISAKASAKP